MNPAGLLLTLAVLTACGAEPGGREPSETARASSQARQDNRAGAGVHFPKYLPPGRGGPDAYMEAGMGGVLTLEGRCLGFAARGGRGVQTIVWPPEASLGSDASGLFVAVGRERFRLGEDLRGGGGTMPTDFTDAPLARPFPTECDRTQAVQFHSIRRASEVPSQPLVSPPPPPTGG